MKEIGLKTIDYISMIFTGVGGLFLLPKYLEIFGHPWGLIHFLLGYTGICFMIVYARYNFVKSLI